MGILNFIFMETSWASFYPSILGYIDPGTGSIIIQAIIATVVGVGVALTLFWHRVLKFLGIRKSIKKNENTKQEKGKQ